MTIGPECDAPGGTPLPDQGLADGLTGGGVEDDNGLVAKPTATRLLSGL